MILTPPESPRPCEQTESQDIRIGQIIADRYQLIRVLGTGAYGTVYQGRDVTNGAFYAVKALSKNGLDARQEEFQKREVRLHLRASQHHGVVAMRQIIDSPDCIFVVLEYCEEGDLFAKIVEEGHYIRDDPRARSIFLQLLQAVQFCHANGIYHRDLKPENVMVKDNGATVKLADFGLATERSVSRDFGCGSTFYMSPECQDANPRPNSWYQSAPNDVWALGVILVNLTCGRNPWKRASMDDSTFREFRRDPDFLRTILPISEELNYILQQIFEVNPAKRITVEGLISIMKLNPRLTNPIEKPPTPKRTPTSTVTDCDYIVCDTVEGRVDSPMADNGLANGVLENVPTLDLPSPQHPALATRRQIARPIAVTQQQQQQQHYPPSPPGSVPSSPAYTACYTTPGRSQVPYASGTLFVPHLYNTWTTCASYPAHALYNQYMVPLHSVVYC